MLRTYTLDFDDVQEAIAEWMLRHLEIKVRPKDVDMHVWMECACGCECSDEDITDYGVQVAIDIEDDKIKKRK
jgi:hypothetical protein